MRIIQNVGPIFMNYDTNQQLNLCCSRMMAMHHNIFHLFILTYNF